MKNGTENLEFSVPLTKDTYQIAQKFSREQHDPEKAQQVYLNTLAVYAVNFYLNCMEVETNLEESDRSNPALRSLMDVADLPVKDWGKLECRPVLPKDKICHIPAESLADRVGYVVVEIDEEINQAKLLGFANTAPEGRLEISQLNSLEQLIYKIPEEPEKEELPSGKILQILRGKQPIQKSKHSSALRQILQVQDEPPLSKTEITQYPEDTY